MDQPEADWDRLERNKSVVGGRLSRRIGQEVRAPPRLVRLLRRQFSIGPSEPTAQYSWTERDSFESTKLNTKYAWKSSVRLADCFGFESNGD